MYLATVKLGPEEVKLSREDGEALRTRLSGDALTAADRRVLDQVLQWYFSDSTGFSGKIPSY